MLLKKYFEPFESTAFGPFLSNFKSTFTIDELNSKQKIVQASRANSIVSEIYIILQNAKTTFKSFILSASKESQYDICRTLDKVPDINKLIGKFNVTERTKIEKASKALLNHIHENGNTFYAIAKGFEGSNLELLPQELIGHIFDYVKGDIDLS